MKQHYLVVEGCIGTEKTELAEKLAFFFDALFIKEDYGENSFLSNQLKKPKQHALACLLYTSPSPRDRQKSRMPSSA